MYSQNGVKTTGDFSTEQLIFCLWTLPNTVNSCLMVYYSKVVLLMGRRSKHMHLGCRVLHVLTVLVVLVFAIRYWWYLLLLW